MGFPGVYQRNSIWNFQGLIKTKWNIQGWPRKSNMEFPRVFVFGLEISKARDLAQFYGISDIRPGVKPCFVRNFQGLSKKNEKFQVWVVQKSISSTLPIWIFLE